MKTQGDETQLFVEKDNWRRHFRVRRILLTRFRFMGDIVLTTSLLPVLKEQFPQTEIDYLAELPYAELLLHHPMISRVWALPPRGSDLSMRNRLKKEGEKVKALRRRHYDLTIDLLGIPRSAFLTRLTMAPLRVGGRFRYRHHFYTHKFDPNSNWDTAIDFHFLALKALGIEARVKAPSIFLLPDEVAEARQYLIGKGLKIEKPIIGIHPGATWPAKIWPTERFIRLIHLISKELGVQVLITYGPGDLDIVERMRSELPESAKILDLVSLRKLAAILSLLALFISNDCGPMHIAPAVGTPTIGIFGPSEPNIWFPYSRSQGHRWLQHKVECHPCHQDICPLQHQCMMGIEVSRVFETVKEVFEEYVA